MTNKERLFTLICVVILTIMGVGCGSPEYVEPPPRHCDFPTIEGVGYLLYCGGTEYQCLKYDDTIADSGCYFEDFNKTHVFNCVESCK